MGTPTIHINLDEKCKKCGESGATKSGYCLGCVAKMIKSGKFDHIIKPIKKEAKAALAQSKTSVAPSK